MLTPLTKHKNTLIPLSIFLAIFITLGLPFKHWGFLHDDWGVVYHAKTTGNDLPKLFTEGSMTAVVQPSNYIVPEQSFLAVLYRPLVYLFLHVQMLFVGVNAYPLMLITIFFHALNAVLLFFLLLGFITFWESFFATLLFAFHLSLWDWMGWIAGQNQVVNLTLVLVIIMMMRTAAAPLYSLRSVGANGVLSAFLLYTISLFYREEALIMPFWFLLMVRYPAYAKATAGKLTQLVPFLLATATYFLVRLYNFPLKTTGAGIKGHTSITGFLYSLKDRFFDAVTLLADIANLAWLPGGNRLLKGSLLALFISMVIWLFYKNNNKKIILYCVVSMFMWMWPAVWRYYSSRFLYMGLPFLVVTMVLLVTRYRYKNSETQTRWLTRTGTLCMALTIINGTLLFTHLKHREHELHTVEQAFTKLAKDPTIADKALCFIGLPYDTFVTGVAQAMWLHGLPASTPVYYDNTTFVWGTNIKPGNVSITRTNDGFLLTTHNPDQAWFLITNSCMPMGEKVVERERGSKIIALRYRVEQKYFTAEHVWVTWDYENHCFKLLTNK